MLNPSTSVCAVDMPKSTEFPFRNPYFQMLDLLVISFRELSVSEQDHGHMEIEEEMK
jgi:hypothetical protein